MKLEKITGSAKRRYDDACAATHGMDIIGERWALPVMRELMLGPRRFSDLRRSLPLLSANVLTQRLTGLEDAGIVVKQALPAPANVQVYALTRWGQEAGPIFQALGRWAARSPHHDPMRPFSPVSLMLSMRTMIDPAAAAGLAARLGFRIAGEDFFLTLGTDGVAIGRGLPADPDLIVTGSTHAIAGALYAGVPLDALLAAGELELAGDRTLAERYVTLFPMPDKVAVE
ncbi:MAG: winged helix-turn-helix transcriptional regulator [Pseudomonadota bacterium]